ncbi:adenylyl-sulfate kinase [Aliidongia dinghuensis]|uniref:Adenylyl-sulfate kinase n=1 Tax=Aliidongia dinghuensis TaxID=1867774 RepID=A0A8J2YX83_9PROT|nr:AAA family ATPase [Aliidongia dinghuensis]GGF35453.1 adenylyl-sulfate kinase [Aliidongia dinghuensis]
MLIVFGGLPGTGKTTLARAIAVERQATYLRVDTIEQALRDSGMLAVDVGPAGYLAAYALAEENLRLGRVVVVDAVNPLAITRQAWRRVAERTDAAMIEIEVICSDRVEHRRRVETRTTDISGLVTPTWQQVLARKYEAWEPVPFVLDTAGCLPAVSLDRLRSRIAETAA